MTKVFTESEPSAWLTNMRVSVVPVIVSAWGC